MMALVLIQGHGVLQDDRLADRWAVILRSECKSVKSNWRAIPYSAI
jgi:hypothetical protein